MIDSVSDPYLRRIALEHGVFLRQEALEVGLDDRLLKTGLRRGHLFKVRHGAYTFADLQPETDRDRAVLHARAVMRTHGDRVALSHTSSVLLRPVETWGIDLSRTHVTRLRGGPARQSKDIAYHQGQCEQDQLDSILGVPATKLPRALVETATISSVEAGVVLFDSATHKQVVTLDELHQAAATMEGWPGTQHVDLALRLTDRRAESVGESRCRYLMWTHGIPLPELQYEVRDSSGVLLGTTDFAWPQYGVLGEFDGKAKYLLHLRPNETPGDAVFREKKREDLLRRATGWSVIRLVWADLFHAARTAAMIRSELRRAA